MPDTTETTGPGHRPDPQPGAPTRPEQLSVYERIKAMILSNQIPPDTKVNIDKLARQLSVSQTPVREAVQRLEGDKLVARRQPRGYWTTPLLNAHELRHMFEVRLLLEPWTARAAATDRTANPGQDLLDEVDRFIQAYGQHEHGYELASHDVAFHDALFESVGNRFLSDAYRQIHAHLHLFRLYPADLNGEQTVAEHRRIAEAVLAADPAAAEQAMRDHLFAAMRRFSLGFTADSAHGFPEIRSTVVRRN
ncbi:GntR family transcriptional regulator [Sediminivirga luteola]|uniref:GntR family transcriptional regulator n=1 Tax=Sediminivirga luteola TaxID=1774748 RepID=UPI001F562377|nr:GntR family transcriptional regulator [Sediminivirga luteola]MCI2266743.1 GntR family transcriptional regulator [Sediminivirga luteola]